MHKVDRRNSNHTRQDVKSFPEKCFWNDWVEQPSTGLMRPESAQDTEQRINKIRSS